MVSAGIEKYVAWCVIGMLSLAAVGRAEPLLGRAIVASLRGDASYEWDEGEDAIEEGMALTEGHRVRADGGAAMCLLLTPGALVCVRERSELDLDVLEHTSEGLPAEGQPALRRIGLRLGRGAILVHAGPAAADREITVNLGNEHTVKATGGSFTLVNERGKRFVDVEEGEVTVASAGRREILAANERMSMQLQNGVWQASVDRDVRARLPYDFQVCRRFFGPLGPMAFDWDWDNMSDVGDWISPRGDVQFVGVPREWQDVSPSLRRTSRSQYPSSVPPAARPGAGGQWTRPDIWDWYRNVGTLRGVNYLPRTAVNPIEMWQAETFDTETIDQELGWARDVGLDSVRVFVPYVVWSGDADSLKDRMDRFLELASDHDLSTVFVLFDDRQAPGMDAAAGPQPEPVPGVHNSRWTASPGHDLVPEAAGEWPQLKAYVQDMLDAFGDDDRVLMWDLYNEPGHSGMADASLPLVKAAFEWAREEEPEQPLTAGFDRSLDPANRKAIIQAVDVVTLADYQDAEQMRAMLALAGAYGRPVVCTGWLRRGQGNTFEDILPVFSQFGVGWYHWGLVQGRSQLYMPWDSRPGADPPAVWEQDLLTAEGEPLNEDEIRLIKGFSFDDL